MFIDTLYTVLCSCSINFGSWLTEGMIKKVKVVLQIGFWHVVNMSLVVDSGYKSLLSTTLPSKKNFKMLNRPRNPGPKGSRFPNPTGHSWIINEPEIPRARLQRAFTDHRSQQEILRNALTWQVSGTHHLQRGSCTSLAFIPNREVRIPSFQKRCSCFQSPLYSDVIFFEIPTHIPAFVSPVYSAKYSYFLVSVTDGIGTSATFFCSLWTITLFASLDSSFTLVCNLESHRAFALF